MRCINCGAELPKSDSVTVECEYCGCKQKNPLPLDCDTVTYYADEVPIETYKAEHAEMKTTEKPSSLEYGVVTPNEIRKEFGIPIMKRVRAIEMPTKWHR